MNSLLIRVGHSPDPDDAFMFYALAKGKLQTGRYRFEHELVDIETLNRRAFQRELELTAVSLHAYAHLTDRYVLCTCGASMGDRYGPMLVARRKFALAELKLATIAVPGTLTTAYLVLRMCLGSDFSRGGGSLRPDSRRRCGRQLRRPADRRRLGHPRRPAHLSQQDLALVADMGQWWFDQTGLPLPLGGNAIRRDLGRQTILEVQQLLRASIQYGLDHRQEALDHALSYGRGLDLGKADQFVGMYVNDWTLDFGPRGREAVAQLLARGHAAGVIPQLVVPEFAE